MNNLCVVIVLVLVVCLFLLVSSNFVAYRTVKDINNGLVTEKDLTNKAKTFEKAAMTLSSDETVPIIIQNVNMKLQTYGRNITLTHHNLASEVKQISHHPTEMKIIVHLFPSSDKLQRQCKNPRIFGRLSGPAVALIEWDTKQANIPIANFTSYQFMEVTQIIGYYNVPVKGKYFIEIIGLFCNDLQWNQNYKEVCLEDPTTHRITSDDAFIDVTEISSPSHPSALGFWKMQKQQDSTPISPLFTRYQPQQCRSEEELKDDRCRIPMSRDQFDPYIFEFSTHTEKTIVNGQYLNKTINDTYSKELLLCFVGLSHAREMAREVNSFLLEWNVSSKLNVINIDAQFPRLVNPQTIVARGCDATVIAAGQWSAGRKPAGGKYRNLPPTLFPEYQIEMKEMIDRLQQSDLKKIYLRDVHYNALGDVKTTCPPQDWRSPPVIEGYNEIKSQLCLSMNVSFIDTRSIVGPMWDISEDFCHYRYDKVAKAEALYVLSRIYKDVSNWVSLFLHDIGNNK